MTRLPISLVSLGLVFLFGCEVEHPPTREQQQQAEVAKETSQPAPPPEPAKVDDAQLVLSACGRPQSDQVHVIYSKLNNGPVRELSYHSSQEIRLDFIPSLPPIRTSDRDHPQLRPGSLWRFSLAHMENQDLLTSKRLRPFLPCAAQALSNEY